VERASAYAVPQILCAAGNSLTISLHSWNGPIAVAIKRSKIERLSYSRRNG